MPDSILLTTAVQYARRGWSIIPIAKGTKRPAIRSWKPYQTVCPTEEDLRRWFLRPTVGGLAVVLGPVSGDLVCRDFDRLDAYECWASLHPDLGTLLPTVATARGRHLYFVGRFGRIVHTGDGEVRGNGYCLLPPSLHPSGLKYRWLVPLPGGPLPKIDPFAVGLADATERQRDKETERLRYRETEAMELEGAASADEVIERTLPTRESQRNRDLFELARGLRSLAQYTDADLASLEPIVRRWHDLALPVIGTKDFETTWFEFRYGWKRVRSPWGRGTVETAFAKAKQDPPPPAALRYRNPGVRLLVCLCFALQGQPFQGGPFRWGRLRVSSCRV